MADWTTIAASDRRHAAAALAEGREVPAHLTAWRGQELLFTALLPPFSPTSDRNGLQTLRPLAAGLGADRVVLTGRTPRPPGVTPLPDGAPGTVVFVAAFVDGSSDPVRRWAVAHVGTRGAGCTDQPAWHWGQEHVLAAADALDGAVLDALLTLVDAHADATRASPRQLARALEATRAPIGLGPDLRRAVQGVRVRP